MRYWMRNLVSSQIVGRIGPIFWLPLVLWPLIALAADNRPDTLAAAGGNPLALNAFAFLWWYWKLFLILALVAVVVRFIGWMPANGGGDTGKFGDDPYLIAYVAGGPNRVVETVLASLVQQGALRVNPVSKELIAEEELPPERPKIERITRALLAGTHQVERKAQFQRWVQQALRPTLTVMQKRLLRAGLISRPVIQAWTRIPLVLGFVGLLGTGVMRLIIGVSQDRPVGFLVASMVLTGFLGYRLLRGMAKESATSEGRRLLKDRGLRLERGGDDRVWKVSLFGLSGFGLGPMADLGYLVQQPPSSGWLDRIGGNRGGDRSTGTGGGCGDGGCGGCGGHGG